MISLIRAAVGRATLILAGTALVVTAATTAASAGTTTTPATTTVMTRTGPMGTYLTDGQGRSLYLFVIDTGTTSNCNGPCAQAWPPLITSGTTTAGPGVSASKLGTTNRSDGTKQVTYAGHPLYLYALDRAAGETNGQGVNGFGGLWWLVSPDGKSITTTGSSAPASPSSGTTTGGATPGHSATGGGAPGGPGY